MYCWCCMKWTNSVWQCEILTWNFIDHSLTFSLPTSRLVFLCVSKITVYFQSGTHDCLYSVLCYVECPVLCVPWLSHVGWLPRFLTYSLLMYHRVASSLRISVPQIRVKLLFYFTLNSKTFIVSVEKFNWMDCDVAECNENHWWWVTVTGCRTNWSDGRQLLGTVLHSLYKLMTVLD